MKRFNKTAGKDIHQEVTNKIVAILENGDEDWSKRFAPPVSEYGIQPLRHDCKTPYQGINTLILWAAALEKGYKIPVWLTFNQIKAYGGSVKSGEKATSVVFFKAYPKETIGDDGEKKTDKVLVLRHYNVFNVCQTEGLPERFHATRETFQNADARDAALDAFVQATGITIHHGASGAAYYPSEDVIRMPDFEYARDKEAYYATLFHEMVHWTKTEKRCNRPFAAKHNDDNYAREELVAELGAAFLCAHFGIASEMRKDHAAYLKHYLAILKADKRAIFKAAADAQKATSFLLKLGGLGADTESDTAEEGKEAA